MVTSMVVAAFAAGTIPTITANNRRAESDFMHVIVFLSTGFVVSPHQREAKRPAGSGF
jgi:hypothetical protein